MKIVATSIFVEDQEQAQQFYTKILGFELKHNIDMGGPKWLTVKRVTLPIQWKLY